ncbi:MAG: hypothetical protein HQL91_06600 [Magnetococcales bacterium]|nr:hypothetical protein [Magnetococcales bacterium]
MKKSWMDQWIVDLDGTTHLMRDNKAERVDALGEIRGSKWILSDFGGAAARFMSVDAPKPYAELVAQRRLLESGDIHEHARLFSHWKRARGKTSTEVYFTAVEAEVCSAYEDRAHDDDEHHLLFSIHALVHACLRAFSANKTIVVLFEHDRHVDLLLGRSGQILAASRISSYGNTRAAKENQPETVTQEIRALLASAAGKLDGIVHFGWLIGGEEEENAKEEEARLRAAAWGQTVATNLQVSFQPLPAQTFAMEEGAFVVTSIPAVLDHLTVADSSSPDLDRWHYLAWRLMPQIAFVGVCMVAVLILSALWLEVRTALLTDEAKRLTTNQTRIAQPVDPVDPSYQKQVTFIDNLSRLKAAPTLQALLNDLSRAHTGQIALDRIVIESDDRSRIQLTLKGRLRNDFSQASQEHETFVGNLTSRGFRLIQSDLTTDVTELLFTLKLERE